MKEEISDSSEKRQAEILSGQRIRDSVKRRNKKAPTIMQVLPALDAGGAEQGCLDINAELVRAGSESLVVCNGGLRLHEIARGGGRHINLPVDSKNPLVMLHNINRLRALIREWDVDVVHVRSRAPAWSCYYACRKENIPLVTTFHAPYKISGGLKRRYNAIMTRGARIVAISQYVADYIKKNYSVDVSRIRTIYRGIPLEIFHPTSVSPERMIQLSKQWRLPDESSVIMLPGRLTRWKGHKVFIEAIAKVKNPHAFAVIVGSDQGRKSYRKELENLILSYGVQDRIRLVDHCNDLPAAYMLSTVVVSASTEPEGFGRIPVEAQAMGRIAIGVDHGASKETVRHGVTGYLVPPGDPVILASYIEKALQLPEAERVKMATRAMAFVEENFARETMVNKVFAVYAELLQDHLA